MLNPFSDVYVQAYTVLDIYTYTVVTNTTSSSYINKFYIFTCWCWIGLFQKLIKHNSYKKDVQRCIKKSVSYVKRSLKMLDY